MLEALPKTVKKVAVLDKTREETSYNPLHLDCLACLKVHRPEVEVYGGTYGLASKPFTPNMVLYNFNFLKINKFSLLSIKVQSVFDNLKSDKPVNCFTVGIVDDVTNTSLKIPEREIKVK